MNKFDRLIEEARVKKTNVTKKTAKIIYDDYWNMHTRTLETLASEYGQDWVDENHDEINREIDHILDVLYNKVQKRTK